MKRLRKTKQKTQKNVIKELGWTEKSKLENML